MEPPIEDLLDKVDSKFTLVALSSKRARQINSYYNQLGEGLGVVVPPQVTSVSGKPLTIAFEEISAGKATYHRIDPDEEAEALALAELAAAEAAAGAEVDILAVTKPTEVPDMDILAVTTPTVEAEVAEAEVVLAEVAEVAEMADDILAVTDTAAAAGDDGAELPAEE
jgi:DNA-directed RNA polymerase subunit omega